MRKLIERVKRYLIPTQDDISKKRYANAAQNAKNYCYYAEDSDGYPTIAISGSNVFQIVSEPTNLDLRKVNVKDAVRFIKNQREEYISVHFNDPIK